MPDIDDCHFMAFVKYLIDYAIISNAYPVKVFCAGQLVSIVGNRVPGQVLNVLKNVRDDFPGNFPEILFSAFFKGERILFHASGSHQAFFQLVKAYRTFIPPFCNHSKIMDIFLEVLVFLEREDNCDFVAIFIDNVLFSSSHGNS